MSIFTTIRKPLSVGLRSAIANRVPMAVLWGVAITLALSYYFVPGFVLALSPVAEWQGRWGPAASAVNQVVFCGIVPGLFMFAVKSIRPRRALLKVSLQSLWSASWGVVYFYFYGLQSRMFGSGHGWETLLPKMMFDQFVWSPLVAVPLNAAFYLWVGCEFSRGETFSRIKDGFLGDVVLPNLVSSWCVWIPTVIAVYAFPPDLQVQVMGLVCSFWSLLCLEIGRRCASRSSTCQSAP